MAQLSNFYVYIWRDPSNCVERYVGWTINKNRPHSYLQKSHNKQLEHMIKTRNFEGYKLEPEIIEVKSENVAKLLECSLIEKYGRKDMGTGTLFNLTDGGDGATGWVASSETRKKMSLSKIGHIVTVETRNKIGQKHKNKIITESSKNKRRSTLEKKKLLKPIPVKIYIPRNEINARISFALRGHIVTEETKKKIGDKTRIHRTGVKQTPEHAAKRAASRKITMELRSKEQK